MKARILGGALILGYHRVASVTSDDYEICVSPEHFAEHMNVVSRYAYPIHLSSLVQKLREGTLPPNSVAVTFDDGYADNLYQAKPILEKYGVPATVFVCTGYNGREFWWDELIRLVMSSDADPQKLCLEVGENRFYGNNSKESLNRINLEDRKQFQHALYRFLLSLDMDNLNLALCEIREWAGLSSAEIKLPKAMNHAELLELDRGELIEIGSHTRNHPLLPKLSLQQQREEVVSGKRDLEAIFDKPIEGFAYPNGRATEDLKKILKEEGFSFACTSLHDVVRPGGDRFELTRFWQEDVGGDEFMKALRLWMNLRKK